MYTTYTVQDFYLYIEAYIDILLKRIKIMKVVFKVKSK